MSLPKLIVPPLDPNNFTGPVRLMSGLARMDDVTLDTAYGEFARWLYVGVAGAVSIVKWDGTTQLIPQLAAGVFHPICSVMVNTVGTTATGIIWGS